MANENLYEVGASGNGTGGGDSIRNIGVTYTERNEHFGGINPYGDEAHMANDNQDPVHKIRQKYVNLNNQYSHENMCLNVVDVKTGDKIPIYVVNDGIRLARGGNNIKDDQSVVYHNFIPNDPLGRLKVSNTYHYNARSSVEALGLYISKYIEYQATHLGDKNSDLGQIEDVGTMNDLVFRNYIKGGGAAPRNPMTGKAEELCEDDENEDVQEIREKLRAHSEDLGIGLGHCMVMNPVFQFNKRDDVRTNPMYTKIGRVYSTQIMNNWPIVLLQPGRLKYNTGFFKMLGLGGGAGASELFIRTGGEGLLGKVAGFFSSITDAIGVVGTVGSAIFGGGKIVEFKQAINMFNMYVRSMWMLLSQMMGLWSNDKNGRYVYNGAVRYLDLTRVLPTLHLSGGLAKFNNNQFIPFRCQKGVVGNETFSNSTETNPLMEEMNAAATSNAEEGANQNSFLKSVANMGLKFLGQFSDKAAVMSGQGRITLPDVYASSSFQRSISLSFEFHYPYGDALGKFENTLLQFQTLLTMGLARQTGKMTYTSPFAVRVYIKNHIFINYGMIESISVTRGGDSNDWCSDGYPKTIKVDVGIKDMEPNISLPLASRGPLRMALEVMFPTSGISEYLGSIGGLSMDELTHNFRKAHATRAINMFRSSWGAKLNVESFLASVANTRIMSNILTLFKSADIEKMQETGDIDKIFDQSRLTNMTQGKYTSGYNLNMGQPTQLFDLNPANTDTSALSALRAEQQGAKMGAETLRSDMSQASWNGV